MTVVQFVLGALCLLATWVNVRQARRYRKLSNQADRTIDICTRSVMAMVMRCRPYLECDHCHGQLDPRELYGIAIGFDGHELVLSCSTCANAEQRHMFERGE